MASNWSKCGVCDDRQVTTPSVVWCSECDKGLCVDCNEHHSVSKASGNHETVYIADNQKLPTEILQIAQFCKIHNEKYELFCRKHDCPCCKKCVKTHNDCKDLTDIKEIISNVKASSAFYDIEQTILELAENVRRIRSNREDNLKSLKMERGQIEAEIEQTRIKLNNDLDILKDEVIKELMTAEQTESKKIHKLLNTLKAKETQITKYQSNMCDIKQHASELQTFLTIKHIEKDLKVEEKFIRSITESSTTNQVNIISQINKNFQKFAKIDVWYRPRNFTIQTRKDRQAQIMVALPARNIDNLTLRLQKRINIKLSDVSGCSKLLDGRMIFSCYDQNKISIFKPDGSKDFDIISICYTFDVVFIGDDSIAVTCGDSKKINVIDLKKKKLKKSIKINSHNRGVVYRDGHLIYCASDKGLQMINLRDESITNVTNNKVSGISYVTTFGDKLFYTNYKNDSVTCCDYHGNILWTFCDTRVLSCPLGITVDNGGNVFVVGHISNNVVIISSDGLRHRQLLSREDGLKGPQVLHYGTSTNTLLVANECNDAFLYEVKL
ncbi:uncharacterized protein LOC134687658 [Mytilus trossulus]|uniref:uncharacterized protein LOC134687658 n=1 Tax=Mytilus trossulus TaxID=6551 RepID=UPI0030075D29